MPGKVLVTGATGYIGAELCRRAARAGWSVVAAARRDPGWPGVAWVPYALGRPIEATALEGCTLIVHLAAETRSEALAQLIDEADEIAAARDLIDRRPAGCRVVFVSSQSAAPDAPTRYGRVKARIEAECAAAAQCVVVRPGLVYGGAERGLWGRLCGLARALPAVPLLWPAPRVQPIHVADLALALLRLAATPASVRRIDLGAADPVSFSLFWAMIRRDRLRRAAPWVPLPRLALQAAAPVLRRLGVETDRITALYALAPLESGPSLDQLGLVLRPLADGMHPSGSARRRRLAAEGRQMIRHLGFAPNLGLLRRYVRAVEAADGGAALPRRPSLALRGDGAARARLALALTLAEFTPAGAARLLPSRRRPWPLAALRLGLAVAAEGAGRLAAALIRRPGGA